MRFQGSILDPSEEMSTTSLGSSELVGTGGTERRTSLLSKKIFPGKKIFMNTPIYDKLHEEYAKDRARRAGIKVLEELKEVLPNPYADFDPKEWPNLRDSISHTLIDVLLDIQNSVYQNRTKVEADHFNLGFFLAFETIQSMEALVAEEKI